MITNAHWDAGCILHNIIHYDTQCRPTLRRFVYGKAGQDGPSGQVEFFNFWRSMVIIIFHTIADEKVITS